MAGFVFYMTFLFKKGMDEENNGTVCKNMTMNIYYYFLI